MKKALALVGTVALVAIATGGIANSALARDEIRIVGSSTVFPFATAVAEEFGKTSGFKTPVIESTGSGGGLKLFCEGVGTDTADITNSSRRIKKSEVETCAKNGVTDIHEVKIGFDGIVLANAKSAARYSLTLEQVYLALAKRVPDPSGREVLVPNPYERWSQIDASLPDAAIEVLGPPPTSGTRDAFNELVMEGGCKRFRWVAQLPRAEYLAACHTLRDDGRFIESGENDNLIVQKLAANPRQLGVFGFSFLEQNADKVQGVSIDGVEPTFDEIASGDYPVARPLYFYVKKAHVGVIPGLREYLAEFTGEAASGEFGYLTDNGLIPLSADEHAAVAARARELAELDLASL